MPALRKLTLSRETLRNLTSSELDALAGGQMREPTASNGCGGGGGGTTGFTCTPTCTLGCATLAAGCPSNACTPYTSFCPPPPPPTYTISCACGTSLHC